MSNCPKCEAQLPPRLSSGRVVCSKCGWSDSPRQTEVKSDIGYQLLGQIKSALSSSEEYKKGVKVTNGIPVKGSSYESKPTHAGSTKPIHAGSTRVFLGSLTLLAGLWMMFSGLSYDTSVSSGEYSFRRIVNEGRVSERASIINVGGFLAVCGSIFIASGRSCSVNGKREEERLMKLAKKDDEPSL
jgi:hypothetical protein